MIENFDIDNQGRVKKMIASVDNGSTIKNLSTLQYNLRDRISELKLGGFGSSSYMQHINYQYNDLNWLTKINTESLGGGTGIPIVVCPVNPTMPNSGSNSDPALNGLFFMELNYDNPKFNKLGRKDGNIAQQIWKTRGRERQTIHYSSQFMH